MYINTLCFRTKRLSFTIPERSGKRKRHAVVNANVPFEKWLIFLENARWDSLTTLCPENRFSFLNSRCTIRWDFWENATRFDEIPRGFHSTSALKFSEKQKYSNGKHSKIIGHWFIVNYRVIAEPFIENDLWLSLHLCDVISNFFFLHPILYVHTRIPRGYFMNRLIANISNRPGFWFVYFRKSETLSPIVVVNAATQCCWVCCDVYAFSFHHPVEESS